MTDDLRERVVEALSVGDYEMWSEKVDRVTALIRAERAENTRLRAVAEAAEAFAEQYPWPLGNEIVRLKEALRAWKEGR